MEVLSRGLSSGVVADEIVALFVMTVPAGVPGEVVATSVKSADWPAANVPIVQVTVGPVVQVNDGPLVCVNETKVAPAGTLSVIVTFCASEKPGFRAWMLQAMALPELAKAGPLFVIRRSALVVTSMLALLVLFAGFRSVVELLTVAVFVKNEPAGRDGDELKRAVKIAVAPLASDTIEQVTVPVVRGAGVVQVNVGPEPCTNCANVAFGGTASVSVTFAASAGPEFVTTMLNGNGRPAVCDGNVAILRTPTSAVIAAPCTAPAAIQKMKDSARAVA